MKLNTRHQKEPTDQVETRNLCILKFPLATKLTQYQNDSIFSQSISF